MTDLQFIAITTLLICTTLYISIGLLIEGLCKKIHSKRNNFYIKKN